MSTDNYNIETSFVAVTQSQASAEPQSRGQRIAPAYQPAFNRAELTEIRVPFWGIANHAMHEYHDERR
ncbi:MAG TPA: hypothetical protein G4N94_01870 [Caldilineae bacterium]|nr:hypothetical protein [Caldilineae bacterium]